MLFHTHGFLLLFLPISLAVCWATASRPRVAAWSLAFTGIVFYSFAGIGRLGLLLALILVTFAAVRARASASRTLRRLGLVLLFVAPLVLIGFELWVVASPPGNASLPLGISFYTLNLVSYGLDAARRSGPPSLAALTSYASFFPTLASGPLVRFEAFDDQRRARRVPDPALIELGVVGVIVGLAKKLLVADPLGNMVEPLFADYERLGLTDAWLAVTGYAYQLYFDFSGYTDIAVGLGALLGFRIPPNFDAPYTARDITAFWQRWHMTMSRWFRDYLFLPSSRALLRRRPSLEGADQVRTLCLVLTMVVIGFWHGAQWGFLAWGLYHGLLLAGHARLRRWTWLELPGWAARALTFVAVLVGWVLLRSPSPGMALRILEGMLGLEGLGAPLAGLRQTLLISVVMLLVASNLRIDARLVGPVATSRRSWLLAALLVLSVLSMGRARPFLYFQY